MGVNTKDKGDLAEGIILADLLKQGYKVALPLGENWRCDLIIERGSRLETVQVKYTESDGQVIRVSCRSHALKAGRTYEAKKYTADEVDYIAAYDATSERCVYFSTSLVEDGMAELSFRLTRPKNGQVANVRWADDYVSLSQV